MKLLRRTTKKQNVNRTMIWLAPLAGLALNLPMAEACTRFTYEGANGLVLTGRNWDWDRGINHDLWVLPAGLKRSGQAGRTAADPFHGPNDLQWVSRYGSAVVTVGGGIGDGMNEQGLSGSFTLDSFAEYAKPLAERKDVNLFFALQYVLDNFATVDQAIEGLNSITVTAMPTKLPNGSGFNLMLTLTDASGDNAVFQWEKGTMKIYHGKQYNVTANEPSLPTLNYGGMQAVRYYYRGINIHTKGTPVFLPGTYSSEDRIARVGYYVDQAPKALEIEEAREWAFRIVRSVATAMPFAEPNVAHVYDITGWSAVADLKTKRYYVDVPRLLGPYYVDLRKLDLQAGAPLRKAVVATSNGQEKPATMVPHSGDMTQHLEVSKPDELWDLK
jgi:penicillin V acylase-like amidase (Ntn superfamily)